MTTMSVKVEEIRKYVSRTQRPRVGDVIVVSGAYKIVKSIGMKGQVRFESGEVYNLQTLIHLGAYYL